MLTALDALDDTTAVVTEDEIEMLASPMVARSVVARVSTLPAEALALVEATAVLGEADLRVVATVAGLSADEAAVLADVLAEVGILGWGRPLDYLHPFERNSVYAAIKPARRARLHAHAARALADIGASVTGLAGHLLGSDPSGDEWTASTLVEAALHHLELGDIDGAARLLVRADVEAPQRSLHAEVVRLRAEVDGLLGRDTAVELLGRSARLGLDPVRLAETALDLLDREMDHSSCEAILDMVKPARDELSVRQPLTALRLQLAESVLLPASASGDHDGKPKELRGELAASTTGRLLTAERALRSAARLECTYGELVKTLQRLLTPDLLRGGGLVQRAIIAESLSALVRVGAFATADPMIRSAIAEAHAAERRRDAAAYTVVLAESLTLQGRVVAAEQALTGINRDGDDVISQCAAVQARLFAALRERGGHEPISQSVVLKVLALGSAELSSPSGMFLVEITARLQLLEGDWASALINLDRLESGADQASIRNPALAPWRACRSAAMAGIGRKSEGAALAVENLRLAQEFGSPITIAEALACAARFQPADVQVDLLNQAVALVSGTGAELLRCNLLIDLGFARHYAGDAAAARTAFRDGADHATRLGVTRLASVAGRGLLACGARPRRLQTSGLKSLTPAELRVVRLATDGQTNGSIATSLFINLKTVESHLTRAYKKLGIGDRAELKAALELDESGDVGEFEVDEAG
jgi:DNA-binding CsgD family transcriptional regulator